MSKETGGPAFPLPLGTANCSEPEQSGGMTLHDYAIIKFAAAWTVALASNRHGIAGYSDTDAAYEALHLAKKQADAMLAERAK